MGSMFGGGIYKATGGSIMGKGTTFDTHGHERHEKSLVLYASEHREVYV